MISKEELDTIAGVTATILLSLSANSKSVFP